MFLLRVTNYLSVGVHGFVGVCVCEGKAMLLRQQCVRYLLVMDPDGRGQASMEQGSGFVFVTPSCCPNPGRGSPERRGAL